MALHVLKFGGTSVADTARIRHGARRIALEYGRGNQIVVVVSAMGGVTNQLLQHVTDVGGTGRDAEADSVLAAGEQVTAGLLALALRSFDLVGVSFCAWQLPIRTEGPHGRAKITHMDTDPLYAALSQGHIPIVAGFQGLSRNGRLTTLGRGGSDITAVALAAHLNAKRCDLYKDVPAVYTADPRLIPTARPLSIIDYDDMIQLSALGSKVIQVRSVEMARVHGIPIRVFSSFEDSTGTLITHKDTSMETYAITGITHTPHMVQVTFDITQNVDDVLAALFTDLGQADIPTDMVSLTPHPDGIGGMRLSFVVNGADVTPFLTTLQGGGNRGLMPRPCLRNRLTRLSVVGHRLRSDSLFQGRMLSILRGEGIPVLAMGCGDMAVSVLVPEVWGDGALRCLHAALVETTDRAVHQTLTPPQTAITAP